MEPTKKIQWDCLKQLYKFFSFFLLYQEILSWRILISKVLGLKFKTIIFQWELRESQADLGKLSNSFYNIGLILDKHWMFIFIFQSCDFCPATSSWSLQCVNKVWQQLTCIPEFFSLLIKPLQERVPVTKLCTLYFFSSSLVFLLFLWFQRIISTLAILSVIYYITSLIFVTSSVIFSFLFLQQLKVKKLGTWFLGF